MEYESDEFYENVVFRDSRIIYPLDLATMTDSTAICDPPDESRSHRPHRPRSSVLRAFDPHYRANSVEKNLDLLLLDDIDFCLDTRANPPPAIPPRNASCPPIPPRNESCKVHQYDPVSFEDGRLHVASNHKFPSLLSLSSSPSSSNEKDDELPSSPSTLPRKCHSRVRGLLNKVSNKEWLTGLKLLSTHAAPSKEETSNSLSGKTQNCGFSDTIGWNSGARKDPQNLWTELKNNILSGFLNQKVETPIHTIKLDKVISIGHSTLNASDSFSFEFVSTKEKNKFILTFNNAKLKNVWMERILESCTAAFCPLLRQCYLHAGRSYIKASVCEEWQPVWLLLQKTTCKKLWIHNVTPDGSLGSLIGENLHKVRSVSLVKPGDCNGCSLVIQTGPILIVNWTDHTLYIQCDLKNETENWHQILRSIALESGAQLEDRQLTADDVPVLVECCIKFIETYGVLSEGIYRRSGVQSKIQRLLNRLKIDAWNQHISNEEFTEHDVANVLKRFFRTLPEPLLTNQLYSQWIDGLTLEHHEEQLDLYKRLLNSLPHINRCTLRKLLGHLHVVQNKCEKNLMSVSNLAALWGPTLMTVESARDHTSNFSHTDAETDVVLQLIQYYPWLFDVDREKLAVNDAISEVQERLEQGTFAKKHAGDIRTWIINDFVSQDVAVEIGPRVKVSDVMPKLLKHSVENKFDTSHRKAVLMEVICDGELQRPLHFKESLLPAMLKWADWSEDERKNNHLLFCSHPIIDKLLHFDRNVALKSVFEVYYSHPKTKSFRQCPFEFCQARFTLLKDLKVQFTQSKIQFKFKFNSILSCRIILCKAAGISKISSGTSAVIRNRILPLNGV